MQLRHTRLSRSERDARMQEQRCLYCRSTGHLHPTCPELQGKGKRRSGEGGPLTDSISSPQAQGLFLSTTMAWGISETRLKDSGAGGNFLDAGLANNLALPLVPLDEPLAIAGIDGRSLEPGVVSHHTRPVTLQVRAHTEHIVLFIIHAPDLQLILGYPWLQQHNPLVDWLSRLVLSWGSTCQTSCLQLPKPCSGAGRNPNGLDLSRVSQEYWDLRKAFSRQKAQLLPPPPAIGHGHKPPPGLQSP
ncbi:hypothetical protein P4O66_003553 [Electrophorus voltai]|uniref:CCHC-type domain-containing protein n=1 Tax=Electrophorus voltai TaxID=2609070 RepID=A0AAD8ZSZ5_9TELE|nr:hypothetical protein P4O66_003553 [Electrophorus voltai]